ncbi:MAG: CDP-2,3-bis-(O-geranylgeranyl)-sn-glycerol synthase, partial [Candidatus Hadarchaeota archaeon]|nr:CDP-2,3-bis-(O-geranylgeranyl)-sn-glycerol synthase [Candidatus Hadarchaeota archaeon]
IWFILPAYFANAAPVVAGGGPPIDMGKKLGDGRRILGGGKTIRGFLVGFIVGSLVGILQGRWFIGPLLALGALLGDLANSFLKRRMGIARGGAAPGLDQLSLLVGALLLASLIEVPSLEVILALLILTPPIHLGTNFIGYKLGLKDRPY